MRFLKMFTMLMIFTMTGCQVQQPVLETPTPLPAPPTLTAPAETPGPPTPAPTPVPPSPTPTPVQYFTASGLPFAKLSLKAFQPGAYSGKLDSLPIRIPDIGNPAVIAGLTAAQKEFLSQNGFVILNAGDTQFSELRRSVSSQLGQPYYLTTDAAYHALHISFDAVLAGLEREILRPVLARILQAVYRQTADYAAQVSGQPIEKDVELAQSYLAVAIQLLAYEKVPDPQVQTRIAPQIAQIMGYGGKDKSVLISDFTDDYGAYRPVGHYAGVPELENYFRAMTWLGRVAFQFKDPDNPTLIPSRAPLILTLALREARVDGERADRLWSGLTEIQDFMIGPCDDPGPAELSPLMEQIYGRSLALSDLSDAGKWQSFLASVDQLPAPQLNSTFATSSAAQAASRDWRFMGQRFTLDGFIFQNLVYDKVGTRQKPRKFPSGLDIAAAWGSLPAWQALDKAGETQYENYSQQMKAVQTIVDAQPEAQWLNRFYSAWLYAFQPQVSAKTAGFPPYMRTTAWGYKEVNSLLGSWAELKHDTVLYAKEPNPSAGGGPPRSRPTPAYVEPNPNVFYRLAYAAAALHAGLSPYITTQAERLGLSWPYMKSPSGMNFTLEFLRLEKLARSLQDFGEIAERELQGQALTAEDFGKIQTCLELKECLMGKTREPQVMDPIPVIAAVSGWQNDVLEAGVGNIQRIFVAVPLEGKLEIAQGGVFTYYELIQPRGERLTDAAWRERLQKNPPPAPAWMNSLILSGGKASPTLVFRTGDVYRVSAKGATPSLALRAGPSLTAAILANLDQKDYLALQEGPVQNAEGTWWKAKSFYTSGELTGWILENPEWLERSAALEW